jgi:hypothetical protein
MNITQELTDVEKGEATIFRRQESIFIESLPEEVFHYISDLRRYSEWGRGSGSLEKESLV